MFTDTFTSLIKFIKLPYVFITLAVYILLFILFYTPLTPVGAYFLKDFPTQDHILDLKKSGYSPREVSLIFDALGTAGRSSYIRNLTLLDVVIPVVLALFLLEASGFLLIKLKAPALCALLLLFPLLYLAFDLGENVLIITLLLNYPAVSPLIAGIANYATLTKWVFSNAACLSLLLLAAAAGGLFLFKTVKKNIFKKV